MTEVNRNNAPPRVPCPVPPFELVFDGSPNAEAFLSTGIHYRSLFKKLCDIKPHEHILDVGCATGRMAIPLTEFLAGGTYDGFDIVKTGTDWLTKNITPLFPNFTFKHADIYNKFYNPEGTLKSEDFKFPYPDESFDFVFLTSVFTHMLPESIANYLREIFRVLKPAGRAFITHFIWNSESAAGNETGNCFPEFSYHFGHYHTRWEHKLEAAVAYDENWLLNLYESTGLKIAQPVHFGSWCKSRENCTDYQDVIIAYK